MHQELDDDVEQVVAVVAGRVDFVADEVELRRDGIAAQDAALRLVLPDFLHDVRDAAFLHIAQHDVAAVESARDVRQRMQLRVQISREQMENDSGVAGQVRLVRLRERHGVELEVLHAASFGQVADALHKILLVGRQLQERNQLRQHRNVLDEVLVA